MYSFKTWKLFTENDKVIFTGTLVFTFLTISSDIKLIHSEAIND